MPQATTTILLDARCNLDRRLGNRPLHAAAGTNGRMVVGGGITPRSGPRSPISCRLAVGPQQRIIERRLQSGSRTAPATVSLELDLRQAARCGGGEQQIRVDAADAKTKAGLRYWSGMSRQFHMQADAKNRGVPVFFAPWLARGPKVVMSGRQKISVRTPPGFRLIHGDGQR
jgi:hypothetical protein